jgi:quercetin dioxygenase-like cupin family protein
LHFQSARECVERPGETASGRILERGRLTPGRELPQERRGALTREREWIGEPTGERDEIRLAEESEDGRDPLPDISTCARREEPIPPLPVARERHSPTIETPSSDPQRTTERRKTVSDPPATRYRWEELPKETLKPDLGRRLISTERVMLAQVYLERGCIVPKHSHENEQLTYIVEGVLRFWLGEDESETVDVAAGEVLHIPSFLPHKAEALETTLDVDIFCPPRQDWLDGSDAYLRAR